MAFKIKTTSPERYRVRPSLGLISAFATNKIEVFYQPIVPDTDDFSDVLKDKFLINLYKNSSETSYKTDSKEKKPSFQHRLKASVKKSLLKTPSLEKNTDNPTVATSIDKDKDVYLKEVCFKQVSSKEMFCQEVAFFCHVNMQIWMSANKKAILWNLVQFLRDDITKKSDFLFSKILLKGKN